MKFCRDALFVENGKKIITTYDHIHIAQIDMKTLKEDWKISDAPGSIMKMAVSPEEQFLLVVYFGHPPRIYDLQTEKVHHQLEHEIDIPNYAGFSKNGDYAFAGEFGGQSMKADFADLLKKIPFSNLLVDRSKQGGLYIYSTETGKFIQKLALGENNEFWQTFVYTPENEMIVRHYVSPIYCWDISDLE